MKSLCQGNILETRYPEVNGENLVRRNDIESMVVWIDELKTFLDVLKSYSALLGTHTHRTEVAVGTMEVELLILEAHLDVDE